MITRSPPLVTNGDLVRRARWTGYGSGRVSGANSSARVDSASCWLATVVVIFWAPSKSGVEITSPAPDKSVPPRCRGRQRGTHYGSIAVRNGSPCQDDDHRVFRGQRFDCRIDRVHNAVRGAGHREAG